MACNEVDAPVRNMGTKGNACGGPVVRYAARAGVAGGQVVNMQGPAGKRALFYMDQFCRAVLYGFAQDEVVVEIRRRRCPQCRLLGQVDNQIVTDETGGPAWWWC